MRVEDGTPETVAVDGWIVMRERKRMLRAFLLFGFCLSVCTILLSANANAEGVERSALNGRWQVAFDMMGEVYETPIEFSTGENGEVRWAVLGDLGTFRIIDTSGRLDGDKLTLRAKTSIGDLRLNAKLEGDTMRGKWSPAGFFARMFIKGDVRGVRDKNHAPGRPLEVFDSVWSQVEREFYALDFNGVDWRAAGERHRLQAVKARSESELLAVVRKMLAELRASHLDFFATPNASSRIRKSNADNDADGTGITWKAISPSVGYIGIEYFADGPEVLARVDRAFAELGHLPSLIIDLRANGGGHLTAAMRLGDHILTENTPVGLYAGREGLMCWRARSIEEIDPDAVPRFSGYYSSDFGRELKRSGALMLITGGRAERPYRGRVVVLIDEYSFSASEAAASVVKETGAATLIGRRTAGMMLGADHFQIVGGWTLLVPVWDYRTPKGIRVEGKGVEPDVIVRSKRKGTPISQPHLSS